MGTETDLALPERNPDPTNFEKNLQKLNKMSMSKVKQNFHSDTESLINKQINMELYASYVYLSMAAYFARDDIALHGFAKRFKEASHEEREHAEKLIEYQTTRGGKVVFREIAKPSSDEWGTALEAVEASLQLERTVNESLEGEYLKEQVEAIKEIADLITKMKRAGDGL